MPAKLRLTDKAIATLPRDPAQKGDLFVWDTGLVGFGLKLSAGGGSSFVYQYRVDGKSRRLTIGSVGKISASAARDRAAAALAATRAGRDPQAEKMQERQAQTIREHAEAWLVRLKLRAERNELSIRTVEEYESKMRVHLLPAFGSKKPGEVTAKALRDWRDKALVKGAAADKPVGPEGIKGALRVFSAFFGYLVDQGACSSNPAKGLGQFSTAMRERYLTDDEAARLGQVLREWEQRAPVWVAVIRAALVSGMRRGEVLQLRWDEVHEGQGVILVARHKTAKTKGTKPIPLTEPLREILALAAQWKRPGCPFIFPSQAHNNIALKRGGRLPRVADLRGSASAGGLKRAWSAIRKEAGLIGDYNFRFHDLRHAWATVAASNGVNLTIIGKNLGQTNTTTTARYAKASSGAAAEAAHMVARLSQQRLAAKPAERGVVVGLPRKPHSG